MQQIKPWLIFASLLSFLCIAIGAFAAHALENRLTEYALDIIDTGVRYQMFGSLGMFAILFCGYYAQSSLKIALICQSLGIILFSGSLYLLAMLDLRFFAFITPVGGVLMLFSWGWVIYTLIASSNKKANSA